tara:strand:+ start:722 stop:919 length:198 start_codon:yes stop_codon:yes gene_type:complete
MPNRYWRRLVKQTLERYYGKLKQQYTHSDLTHEINNQKHNKYYVSQQQINTDTHLENLNSKYQIE